MSSFVFRAARVLDLRRQQEDEARAELQVAEARRQAASDRVSEIEHAIADSVACWRRAVSDGVSGWEMDWHRSWLAGQRVEGEERSRALAAAAAVSADTRARLREAHRKRQMLERLRDRAWRAYEDEARRRENREMDAIAGLRFFLKVSEQEGVERERQ
jgi:flagellar export protein FliJ